MFVIIFWNNSVEEIVVKLKSCFSNRDLLVISRLHVHFLELILHFWDLFFTLESTFYQSKPWDKFTDKNFFCGLRNYFKVIIKYRFYLILDIINLKLDNYKRFKDYWKIQPTGITLPLSSREFDYKLLSNEVCSNYISPVGLFYAIFRLTDFSSDAFDFSSTKTGYIGSVQRALSALGAFQLCFSSDCFRDLYLWCEGRFLEVKDTPAVDPPPPPQPLLPATTISPPPRCCPLHPTVVHPLSLPISPPPWCTPTPRGYVRTTDR